MGCQESQKGREGQKLSKWSESLRGQQVGLGQHEALEGWECQKEWNFRITELVVQQEVYERKLVKQEA